MKPLMDADERRCEPGNGENAIPVPVRYWWAKRIGVGFVVWMVVMLGVRWGWGCEADRRLNAEIAKYQAAGEPVFLEDFVTKPVPDEENAAKLYLEAADTMGKLPEKELNLLFSLRDYYKDKNPDKLGILIKRLAPSLTLVRQARELERFDWGVEWSIPDRKSVV